MDIDEAPAELIVPNPVPRKRRKKSAVSGEGKQSSLSCLPGLSVDILFEIFSHLLPLDLLRIARTSKSFRKLLLNRSASTIWIASRERAFPNYPEPPDGASEPFWANLVFGENIYVKIVDNLLANFSTMKESYIFQVWPDSDKSIVDLVPYVSGLFRSSRNTRFFWSEDIIKVGALLEGIIVEVGRGTPGAAGGLQIFKHERMALVTAVLEHSKECWDASEGKVRNHLLMVVFRLFDRFKALGYDDQAIKDVLKDVPIRPALLTEQAWDDIQTRHEPRLLHQLFLNRRDSVVAAEPPHLEARWKLITELYKEHCKAIPPIERECIPPVKIISLFPPFSDILQRPANVEVPREDFTWAMANMNSYLCAWDGVIDMRMGAIAGLQTTSHDGDPNKINLSWFVTICSHPSHQVGSTGTYRGDVAFSRREALYHLYHDHDGLGLEPYSEGCAPFETLQFSEAGSTAVRSLIKLAGLREEKAMPLHMDFTRARFVCEHCDAEPREGEEGLFKPVMDWRQAANHYVDCWRLGRTNHPQPAWRMLTDVENEAVMKAEHVLEDLPEHRDDPRTWFWRCNLCKTFEPRSFTTAFLHVKQRHFVFQPRVGVGRELYPDGLGVRAHEPAHHIRVDCNPRIVILTLWNGVHKLLEPDLAALQEKADKVNAGLFRARREEMGERYAKWLKKFTPLEREEMPNPRVIYGFPHVRAVTDAPRNAIGDEEYAAAIDGLPSAIAAWLADVDRSLRNVKTKGAPAGLMRAVLGLMQTLDAAVFVTECIHVVHDIEKANWGDIAFGKGEAIAHLLDHMDRGPGQLDSFERRAINPNVLNFLPAGSSAVMSLVDMLGLDETTTTPMDLDKIGAAFVCELCEPHTLLPTGGPLRTIFNWRQAAIHVIDRLRIGKDDHLSPVWRMLTDRELRALKLAEEKCKLEPTYPLWIRCNECRRDRFEARTEKSMMEHLESVHDIKKPVLGEDFYYSPLKAGSLTPVHRICVEPAPDGAIRIRSIGQVGTILSYSELDYRGV
ncbi:hypothetical protein GSI_12129 [Ganoderma sinense ZZ0214-1]|uniref:F-box domain-containing protein n=1 Tax=Ganoderma sinense ZZ0214-1 TaxID=1077348 RepID=A0A2G8RXY0_9APHY|nr:hypothetical protein GSI_12129 [Ganoderma sinense ZZ0214-1]